MMTTKIRDIDPRYWNAASLDFITGHLTDEEISEYCAKPTHGDVHDAILAQSCLSVTGALEEF